MVREELGLNIGEGAKAQVEQSKAAFKLPFKCNSLGCFINLRETNEAFANMQQPSPSALLLVKAVERMFMLLQ